MIVRRLGDLDAAAVAGGTIETRRYLMSGDGAGFSVSDVSVPAGTDVVLHYRHHVEANLVLEGRGTVEILTTGEVHDLSPGTLYAVYPGDEHRLRATDGLRIISIFNPPLVGTEDHDADGSYPAAPTGA